MVKQAGYQMLQ